jgi:hypothetical protein
METQEVKMFEVVKISDTTTKRLCVFVVASLLARQGNGALAAGAPLYLSYEKYPHHFRGGKIQRKSETFCGFCPV